MITKNIQCAICFIPPNDKLSYIQQIRSEYDETYSKWMPHINLALFPLVESNQIDIITEKLQSVLKDIKPFEISFCHFSAFERQNDVSIHLIPEDTNNQMKTIHEVIEMVLELETNPYGFKPHLTVGQFPKEELDMRLKKFTEEFDEHKFTNLCDRIYIIECNKDIPSILRSLIKFGI